MPDALDKLTRAWSAAAAEGPARLRYRCARVDLERALAAAVTPDEAAP